MTNNADSNSSRHEQETQAKHDPLKKPETETAHADAGEVGGAAAKNQAKGPGAHADGAEARKAPYGHETDHPEEGGAQIPEDAKPRGIDIDNDDTSDSTVDTDGKDRDARRVDRLNDREVVNNATLANATFTPPEGLAGIDSRPGGNMPGVLANPGSRVVDGGFTESQALYVTAGEPEDVDDEEHESDAFSAESRKRDEHTPRNHARVGRTITIEPDPNVNS